MAIEQQNNQAQSMAQRPPVSDEGGQMPMEQEQEQGQNQEQQIQQFTQKVQQLSPEEKRIVIQSITPEFKEITITVFGSDIGIFFDILESGIEEMQPTAQPVPQPQPAMAQGGGEGFANRPPEQPQGGGMVQRPQPV